MSGFLGASAGNSKTYLDTQIVTVGQTGTAAAGDRVRGFDASLVVGSISDGTSNIYGGAAITALYWYEGGGGSNGYVLAITGAANSGWTTMTIGSKRLTRAAATYSSGSWTWATTDTIGVAFGAAGTTTTVYFE